MESHSTSDSKAGTKQRNHESSADVEDPAQLETIRVLTMEQDPNGDQWCLVWWQNESLRSVDSSAAMSNSA